jgi:sugar transferase (PEP-CTERM/EpsH1 system associated)
MATDARPLILHVIHQLAMGGMENGLVNLINRMPESSFRHGVLCVEDYTDFRQRLDRADTEVYALHRSRVGIWNLRRELFRLFRRLRPAIVHSRNTTGLDALLPARLAGVPHRVHGEHGWDVDNLGGKKLKPTLLRRIHAPLVERYITVSKDLERFLIERIGIRADKITQIYNGVDTERFSPRTTDNRDALPPGFATSDSVVIGTVGRAQPVKDQANLLRAFAAISDATRQRSRLVIAGDGPLLPELRRLASELGVAPLCWLPGALNNVPELLRALDIFVLPSLAEGISNTVLEAMASGLPVLATKVGGNVELLRDGYCGRFFAPGDVAALRDLLASYVEQPSSRASQGANARALAVERFSLAAMVSAYQGVYERLLSGNGPAK